MSFFRDVYRATVRTTKVAATVAVMLEGNPVLDMVGTFVPPGIKGPLAMLVLVDELIE